MNTMNITHRLLVTVLLLVTSGEALAQADYPSRTIKIVVPLPSGAPANTIPRIVAAKLAVRWSQPVIVENRPGAGQTLGAGAVAKAAPDGYTLLAAPVSALVTSQDFHPKLGFDPSAGARSDPRGPGRAGGFQLGEHLD